MVTPYVEDGLYFEMEMHDIHWNSFKNLIVWSQLWMNFKYQHSFTVDGQFLVMKRSVLYFWLQPS